MQMTAPSTARRTGAPAKESPFDKAWREGIPVHSPPLEEISVSVAEAAGMLGLSRDQVRRRLRSGDLLGVHCGGRLGWRLHRDYVQELAAQAR
jgi:excisionase family DNA binding protein